MLTDVRGSVDGRGGNASVVAWRERGRRCMVMHVSGSLVRKEGDVCQRSHGPNGRC